MTAPQIIERPACQRTAWRLSVALVLAATLMTIVAPSPGSAAPRGCKRHAAGLCIGRLVGPLVVSGHRIHDRGQGGEPILFQGVMFDGPGWLNGQPSYNPRGFPDAGAINTLNSWHINFIRLGLSSDIYEQRCNENYSTSYPGSGYRAHVAQSVERLTSAGIFVLIDLYTSNPDCKLSGPNTSGDAPMPGKDALPFWHAIAKEFAGNPLVGFELWNEPEVCATGPASAGPVTLTCSQANLDAGWTSNLRMKSAAISYNDVGMEAMYRVVRKEAPDNLVFLDANGWAAQPATYDNLPADMNASSQIVDVLHPYDCQDRTPPQKHARTVARCIEPNPEACSTVLRHLRATDTDPATGVRLTRPVMFDEVGFPEGEQSYITPRQIGSYVFDSTIRLYDHGLFLHNFIAEAQSRGEGFAMFTFNDSDINDPWNGPYALVVHPIRRGDPGPWPATPNGAVLKRAGAGPALSCQEPPVGYDTWGLPAS